MMGNEAVETDRVMWPKGIRRVDVYLIRMHIPCPYGLGICCLANCKDDLFVRKDAGQRVDYGQMTGRCIVDMYRRADK
jgi:hypothetical protein